MRPFVKSSIAVVRTFLFLLAVFIAPPPAEAASEVVLVVDKVVQPEIQPGLDRLKADLIAQGYAVKIYPTSGINTLALWDYLRFEYANNGLKGAILIGHVALARSGSGSTPTTDLVYWNMTNEYQNVYTYNIWVSRIWGE